MKKSPVIYEDETGSGTEETGFGAVYAVYAARGADAVVPMMGCRVEAGFPSPADDHLDATLSLDDLLMPHPNATFLVRVQGKSMRDANIGEGDVLVVDRSLTAGPGDIVVAALDGDLTVKRLRVQDGAVRLQAENPEFPDYMVREGQEFTIWGVVTSIIRHCRRGTR